MIGVKMHNMKSRSILIVDDEIEQLRTLQLGLRRKGYNVSTANNGMEAIKILENKGSNFDMVVTDYAMPGMDGMQFLKSIRNKHKDLTVVMMTAYGNDELFMDAMQNQCNGFIEKPFSMDEFYNEIEKAGKKRP